MTDIAILSVEIDSSAAKRAKTDFDNLTQSGEKLEKQTKDVKSATSSLGSELSAAASKIALYTVGWNAAVDVTLRAVGAVKDYLKESAMLNARYDELGIVMKVVGANAGYNAQQMQDYATAVQKMGITMSESRNTVIQLAQANLGLEGATRLARAAQDLAVIGMTNSSDALQRMIYGIKSSNTEVLRTLGINVSFESGYQKLAASLGRNVSSLTEAEKVQARQNTVLEESVRLQGVYEEAMTSASKQMRSMERYTEDLKVKLGETFNEAMTVAVFAVVDSLKENDKAVTTLSENGKLKQWGEDVADTLAFIADFGMSVSGVFKLIGSSIAQIAAEAQMRSTHPIDYWFGGGKEAIAQAAQDYEDGVMRSMSMFRDSLEKRRSLHAADAAKKLAVDKQYAADALIVQEAYINKSIEEQRAAQLALAKFTYPEKFPTAQSGSDFKKKDKAAESEAAAMAAASISQPRVLADVALGAAEYELAVRQKLKQVSQEDFIQQKAQIELVKNMTAQSEAEKLIHVERTAKERQKQEYALQKLRQEAQAIEEKRDIDIAAEHSKAVQEQITADAKQHEAEETRHSAAIGGYQKELEALRLHNAEIGKTKEQVDALKVAEYDRQTAKLQQDYIAAQNDAAGREDAQRGLDQLAEELEFRKKISTEMRNGAQLEEKAATIKKEEEFYKSMWSSVEQQGKAAFVAIFSKGESVLKSIGSALKTSVIDLFYQLTAKQWMISVGVSMGIPGAAAAAAQSGLGGGSGGGGIMSTISGAKTLWDTATGTTSSALTSGYSNFAYSGVGQSLGLSAGAATIAGTGPGSAAFAAMEGAYGSTAAGGALTGAGSAGLGAAGAIGTAIPYVAAAIAVYSVLKSAGVIGPSGTYAQTTGYQLNGTLGPGGFSGQGLSLASNNGASYADYMGASRTQDFVTQMQDALSPVKDSITKLAGLLGLDATSTLNKTYSVMGSVDQANGANLGTAAAAQVAQLMVQDLIPNLNTFQKSGEDLATTFLRLVADVGATKDVMILLGNGMKVNVDIAEQLVNAFGTAANLQQQVATYYTAFYSQEEQLAVQAKRLNAAFDAANIAVPTTKDQFRAMVDALDLTTASGVATFKTLMDLAPAFDKVAQGAAAAQAQVYKDQAAAYQLQATASQTAAQAAKTAADSYTQASASFEDAILKIKTGSLSILPPAAQISLLRGNLDTLFQKTLSGDTAAAAALPQAATDFLTAAQKSSTTAAGYATDVARTLDMLRQADEASKQLSTVMSAQAQLLQKQTDALNALVTELGKPSPDTAILDAQKLILSDVSGTLSAQAQQLITINSSLVDQNGQVISGNSILNTQTGQLQSVVAIGQDQFGQLVAVTQNGNVLNDHLVTTNAILNTIASAAPSAQTISVATSPINVSVSVAGGAPYDPAATAFLSRIANGIDRTTAYLNSIAIGQAIQTGQISQSLAAGFGAKGTGISEAGIGSVNAILANIPQHSEGLDRVPYDGYLMRAHAGETVLNASAAAAWRNGASSGTDNRELIAVVSELRAELTKVSKNTEANAETSKKLNDLMQQVSRGGLSLQTTAV